MNSLLAPHKNFEFMLTSFHDAKQKLNTFVYDRPVTRPQFDDPMLRARIQRLITDNESIRFDKNSEF